VPLTASENWVRDLSGVTIPDVTVQLFAAERSKPLDHCRGSLLFTHFGLSGPVVLDISRSFTGLQNTAAAKLHCDFLPDLPAEHLQEELRGAASADGKRLIANVLAQRLPKRLAEELLLAAGLPVDQRAAEFSKLARAALVRAVKSSEISITGTRGFAKAEVTAGGVALDEIDSRTMESKLAAGLFFAGEILDLDGPIGGYNFQAAFSTGVLAGRSSG
jgi:predicted Rossmann fold flavoprotein